MKAFFLAAGFGTRLRPFTETNAKPAIPFLGLPQILYPYFFSKELGATDVVYNTHHNPESVEQVFSNFNIEAHNYFEKVLLNSAGGLSHARDSLKNENTFLVLNSDTLFIYENLEPFKNAIERHKQENRLATLFTISKDGCGTEFPGLVVGEGKQLINAGLKRDLPYDIADAVHFQHFIGCYIFSNRIFDYISNSPDNLIYDILLKLPAGESNNVKVEHLDNVSWYELGTIKDYKTNHLHLSNMVDSGKDNSFTRAHDYFRKTSPNFYPYDNKLEQQILRSL